MGESAARDALEVVALRQVAAVIGSREAPKEQIDEALAASFYLTLRKRPQLDDLHPPGQGVGDVLHREQVGGGRFATPAWQIR